MTLSTRFQQVMSPANEMMKITKLTDDNYYTWSYDAKLMLRSRAREAWITVSKAAAGNNARRVFEVESVKLGNIIDTVCKAEGQEAHCSGEGWR